MTLIASRFFIIVSLAGFNRVTGAPSDVDTLVKENEAAYSVPKSSMFYHGAWYGFMKQTIVIGAIEPGDSVFTFEPLHGLPGWPKAVFERRYPLNSGFKKISILYKDVKTIRYSGRIKLKNGVKHQMFGIRRRYWRPIYKQIKAEVRGHH
jgi:hypothetical protein